MLRHPLALAALLAIGWIVRAGVLDRAAAGESVVPLRKPLAELPPDVLGPGWRGVDVPLEPEVIERAGVTSHLQRQYVRGEQRLWLYVGYVGRWRPDAIHHPAVCFPASGYQLISEGRAAIEPAAGTAGGGFKELSWRDPRGGGIYTLSSFCYRGKYQPDELRLRWDAIGGIPWFAVVTLSGTPLPSLEETRGLYTDLLRRVLPALSECFPTEPRTS